jgi:hypothetical protein
MEVWTCNTYNFTFVTFKLKLNLSLLTWWWVIPSYFPITRHTSDDCVTCIGVKSWCGLRVEAWWLTTPTIKEDDCSQRRWRSGRSRRQMLARKMDTPLSWNMLLGRELLEWRLPDLSESRPKAGRVKSCFLLHLLPPWWLWSPGTPLPSSPSISVAFTIRHSSLIWKVVAVFLIPYEISGYKY